MTHDTTDTTDTTNSQKIDLSSPTTLSPEAVPPVDATGASPAVFTASGASRTKSDAVKQSRLNSLIGSAEQMVLGTLLGDGTMDWRNTQHGRIRILHGKVQEDYCRAKAELLRDYVNTPPRIVPNDGWGDENCVFNTVTTPAFDFLRNLCYRPDPRYPDDPRRLVRCINKDWLDRITWEGLAWWYQDDGSLSGSGNCKIATLSTHRYPEDQVRLLAQMFNDRGIEAKVYEVHKQERDKPYWVVSLTASGSREFIEKIRPYAHPTLLYKFDTYQPVPCAYCGRLITEPIAGLNAEKPCCAEMKCKTQRSREYRESYYSEPVNRANLNRSVRKRREERKIEDPNYMEKIRQQRRNRFSDPAYREKWNAWKREYRRKRREAGLPRM